MNEDAKEKRQKQVWSEIGFLEGNLSVLESNFLHLEERLSPVVTQLGATDENSGENEISEELVVLANKIRECRKRVDVVGAAIYQLTKRLEI